METLTQSKLKYPEFITFFRQYEDNSDFKSDEWLDERIDWFLANRRLFVIRNKGRLLGLCAFMLLETPSQLYNNEWPKDYPEGKYLWVANIVLHPLLRSIGTMKESLLLALKYFPNLAYIVYFKNKQFKVIKIADMLTRRF